MRLFSRSSAAVDNNTVADSTEPALTAMEVLTRESPFKLSEVERAAMTVSCRDADNLPKVENAGQIVHKDGKDYQIMHNGILMKRGGYYGEWMEGIITSLKGHHEPQEERVFSEILARIRTGGTMIELGSFWSYYSVWFNKTIPEARNFACEPDPENLKLGKENAQVNGADITFYQTAAGSDEGKLYNFPLDSKPGEFMEVPIKTVDSIVDEQKLDMLDVLHMDVQGAELHALDGALQSIKAGKVRFLVISTHHYVFTGDPTTHQQCLSFVKQAGGHIIAEHTILESFSGDGLIVASFADDDKDFSVDISINSSAHSLFRPYEEDLALLIAAYNHAK